MKEWKLETHDPAHDGGVIRLVGDGPHPYLWIGGKLCWGMTPGLETLKSMHQSIGRAIVRAERERVILGLRINWYKNLYR